LKNSNADRLQAEEMIAEMKQHVFLSPLLIKIIKMKLLTHALPVLCPAGGHTRKSARASPENILKADENGPFVCLKCGPIL